MGAMGHAQVGVPQHREARLRQPFGAHHGLNPRALRHQALAQELERRAHGRLTWYVRVKGNG